MNETGNRIFGDNGYVIFSVVNSDYAKLAERWGNHFRTITKKKISFVCSDKHSFEYLTHKGFQCFDFSRAESEKDQLYLNTTFPSQQAAYTVSLKFKFALDLIKSGVDCIYSDVDAFWIRDPIPFLNRKFSIAFQPGSFPNVAKDKWGFSACTGFVAFAYSKNVAAFLSKAISCFDGSDQMAFNQIMLYDCAISWEARPINWEHCRTLGGWTAPVSGQCANSGLSFLALPHSYFQRHKTTIEDCGHAFICHPNSPKSENKKIEVLQALGIWDIKNTAS